MTILTIVGIATCAYAFHFAGTPPVHSQKDEVAAPRRPTKTSIAEKILPALGPAMMVNTILDPHKRY